MNNPLGKYFLRRKDGKIFRLFRIDELGVRFVDLDAPHTVMLCTKWPEELKEAVLPFETRQQFDKFIFSCEIGLHYEN